MYFVSMSRMCVPPTAPLIPYSLPCVRELLRFLVSLTNPIDSHNNDVMIHMGLSLLTVALETGADYVAQYASLLGLVRDDLNKHLFLVHESESLPLCIFILAMYNCIYRSGCAF